jgi:hypothetical protein
MGASLVSINNVDILNSLFSGSVTLRYTWHDNRFIWNPEDH